MGFQADNSKRVVELEWVAKTCLLYLFCNVYSFGEFGRIFNMIEQDVSSCRGN